MSFDFGRGVARCAGLLAVSCACLLLVPKAAATPLDPQELHELRAASVVAQAANLIYQNASEVDAIIEMLGVRQRVVIDRKNVRVFIASMDSLTLIAFRGTQRTSDWLTNANRFPKKTEIGEFHAGFYSAWEEVQSDIAEFVDGIATVPGRRHLVWLGGHSMGGAVAAIGGIWLKHREQARNYRVAGVFTFGQPRIALQSTAARFKASPSAFPAIQRFAIGSDVVTMVPTVGYEHIGEERFGERIAELQPKIKETAAQKDARLRGIANTLKSHLPSASLDSVKAYIPSAGVRPVELDNIMKYFNEQNAPLDAALIREHSLANYIKLLNQIMLRDGDACTAQLSAWIAERTKDKPDRNKPLPGCVSRQWLMGSG